MADPAARVVNRFDLYELCVQAPRMSARFIDALLGGEPAVIGEEFCGPASIAREYVALGGGRRAIASDFDAEPLAHARLRAGEDLTGEQSALIEFHQMDVMEEASPVRALVAFNFALCEYTTRAALLAYLRHARSRIAPGGVYAADLYGGENAMATGVAEIVFETDEGDVLYAWKQVAADPLTGRVRNEIDFELPDGTLLERAFAYDWRLWTPAELADAFVEAGFSRVEFYAGYGSAVADEGEGGELVLEPLGDGEELGEEWVLFVVAHNSESGAGASG